MYITKMRKLTIFLAFLFVSVMLVLMNASRINELQSRSTLSLRSFSLREEPRRSIPRRIHQIWNDDIVPAEFAENVRRFVKDNPPPLWEYYFWTKESGLKLLADKYPYLYERAVSGISDTMRADILRYVVIYEYGGVYFDMDTVSVKPLEYFINSHACAVALEPGEHYFTHKTDFLLTNSALFCRAGHLFFKHLLLRISVSRPNCKSAFSCTGPPLITRLYREINWTRGEFAEIPDVHPSEVFQDMYDVKQQARRLHDNCLKNITLQPYQKRICDNWKHRGMETRGLSEHALTFHTWYHVYGRKMTLKTENNITTLVPHVKIYGRTF